MGLTKFSVIYIFIMLPLIYSSKSLDLEGHKVKKSKPLNECSRCKLLTDSFMHWIEKTARGKHEGGDAAWEEAKLKSYSRSEMRLVEIQEKLCSELKVNQDSCYSIVEDAEQPIERWWFEENHDPRNIYKWLCIDNLKYCCPAWHYGEDCNLCPLNENNEVCSGNGHCDGDGTRKGNGTCICRKGYAGINCDKCAKNFYKNNSQCKPCHNACEECNGDKINNCVHCANGWNMESDVCVDVNECIDPSVCKSNEFCKNTEGSYFCRTCDNTCKTCIGPGAFNCTSCNINDIFWIGKCMSTEFQNHIFKSISIRISIYLILIVLITFVFKKSKSLKSLMVLITSIIIYYFEETQDMGIPYIIYYYFKI